jgi:hypothetical protein
MKFAFSVLLTVLLAYALGLYLDWWSIAIAAFVVALVLRQRPDISFASGSVAILLLWGGYSIFLNQRNGGLLAEKVAFILPLKGNVPLLLFITALVGALVGGMAALTASYLYRKPTVRQASAAYGTVLATQDAGAVLQKTDSFA